MTTQEKMRELSHARQRADRARYYGDHAGHLIAAGDVRRILADIRATEPTASAAR